MFVRLPVMTAVDGAPGKAIRNRPNWQPIAETAIIAAIAAVNPCGLDAGSWMTLKIRTHDSRRN